MPRLNRRSGKHLRPNVVSHALGLDGNLSIHHKRTPFLGVVLIMALRKSLSSSVFMTAMLFPSHVFRAWQRSHAMHDSSPSSFLATWTFFSVLENDRLKSCITRDLCQAAPPSRSPPSRCGRKFAKLLQLPARTAAGQPRANRKPFRRASRTLARKDPTSGLRGSMLSPQQNRSARKEPP